MKKKVVLVLGIVLILCLGLGGKFYMDRKEEQKKQILQAEENIALYIVQNYEGINKIDFQEVAYIKETGSWHITTRINNKEMLNFTTHSLVDINKNLTISYDEIRLQKREDKTANIENVEINYKKEFKQ